MISKFTIVIRSIFTSNLLHTLNIIQNVVTRIDVVIARIILSGKMREKNVIATLRPKQIVVGELAIP